VGAAVAGITWHGNNGIIHHQRHPSLLQSMPEDSPAAVGAVPSLTVGAVLMLLLVLLVVFTVACWWSWCCCWIC
jgi:hypothetical protein